jgi:plastocyanin
MNRISRLVVGTLAMVALAGCSSAGGSAAPAASVAAPAASVAASSGGGGGSAAACSKSTGAGTVQAAIKDFEFDPATVTAKVGDVITWTNNGPTSHTVTVDNQTGCDTGTLTAGSTGSLTFTAAGTYPFHCSIHSSMKGTITITG